MGRTPLDETWERIKEAAKGGNFIPVIGFDVAASTAYADAGPHEGWNDDDGELFEEEPDEEPSFQLLEEQRMEAQLRAIRARLESLPPEESYWDYAQPYLESFAAQWTRDAELGKPAASSAIEATTPKACSSAGCAQLLSLQVALTSAAAVMTREWAAALKASPTPAGTTWLDPIVTRDEATDDLPDSLRRCLDNALELIQVKPAPGALQFRDLNYIYVKLLRLVRDVLGSSKAFWRKDDDDAFAERHRSWMRTKGRRVDCGWRPEGSIPVPQYSGDMSESMTGIRLSHLLWLENLLRFTVLSQTRAYRTLADIAFALSLDDPGIGIPRMPADPLEIGLLYERRETEALEAKELARLVKYCSANENGDHRRPGAFHRALARLLRFYESKPRADGSKRIPIVLVLGIDLEMEHALEEEYDCYQVLMPVLLPKDVRPPDWGAPDSEDGGELAEQPDKSWLFGTFTRQEDGFVSDWGLFGSSGNWEERGPLVIKLFGSPAHDVPPIGEISGDTSLYDVTKSPIHHVVLDETEMIDAILHTRDEMEILEGLFERFSSSMMFCFGNDAVSWGDRAPYRVVSAIRSGADHDVWGSSDAELSKSAGVVALTSRNDQFAEGVWQSLHISHELQLAQITGRIVQEASRCQ